MMRRALYAVAARLASLDATALGEPPGNQDDGVHPMFNADRTPR